ncbi:hypothetical protein Ssi03_13050 [Sphaerisporangium siamense]|uniref:Uncharacterized protein n=1 Tax=Sphaerisporangium siamense TaxID=795645 RepID=A0A7W7GDD9_9ACTN|nr:hypothetical protein [Sphaerisporangium siamense]MBB4702926.1 hypothetical protein [Sphaerisporangium siamense]GII83315.1 hypothetical protein Ssi03_13050 [Sphaerisporangium siamense]
MKVHSYVCDWFAPYEDGTPVILVITLPEGVALKGFDNHPELWKAFYDEYADGWEIDEDGYVSDYIYEVCCLEVDVTPFLAEGSAHPVYVTIGE